MTLQDLTGRRFHRLTVVSYSERRGGGHKWLCVCDCGKQKTVYGGNLRNGYTKSCGCFRNQRVRETQSKYGGAMRGPLSTEYRIWGGIKTRCYNSRHESFQYYGARGIRMCDEWLESFELFMADMGPRPSEFHSIDRMDSDGHYEPSNCRWATAGEQSNNRRNNIRVELDGEMLTAAQASRRLGFAPNTIAVRLRCGFTVERALSQPVRRALK